MREQTNKRTYILKCLRDKRQQQSNKKHRPRATTNKRLLMPEKQAKFAIKSVIVKRWKKQTGNNDKTIN